MPSLVVKPVVLLGELTYWSSLLGLSSKFDLIRFFYTEAAEALQEIMQNLQGDEVLVDAYVVLGR